MGFCLLGARPSDCACARSNVDVGQTTREARRSAVRFSIVNSGIETCRAKLSDALKDRKRTLRIPEAREKTARVALRTRARFCAEPRYASEDGEYRVNTRVLLVEDDEKLGRQ